MEGAGGAAAAMLALAVLVETLVDMIKTRIPPLPGNVSGYLWPLVAMGLGIGLAFGTQLSVAPLLPVEALSPAWADRLLAGFIIGGGATTIYDWLDRRA